MQLKMCLHKHVLPVPKMVWTLIFASIHPPPLNVMLQTDSLDSSLNKFSTVTFIFPKLYLKHFWVRHTFD